MNTPGIQQTPQNLTVTKVELGGENITKREGTRYHEYEYTKALVKALRY